jgi:hypothetical protein
LEEEITIISLKNKTHFRILPNLEYVLLGDDSQHDAFLYEPFVNFPSNCKSSLPFYLKANCILKKKV